MLHVLCGEIEGFARLELKFLVLTCQFVDSYLGGKNPAMTKVDIGSRSSNVQVGLSGIAPNLRTLICIFDDSLQVISKQFPNADSSLHIADNPQACLEFIAHTAPACTHYGPIYSPADESPSFPGAFLSIRKRHHRAPRSNVPAGQRERTMKSHKH